MMNNDELLRYSRHILLAEVDMLGQEALQSSRVVLAGVGGLGSPVALYLAAAGIGHLTLVDFDHVDVSNLQRQVIHSGERLQVNKAVSAQSVIADLNEHVIVEVVEQKLAQEQWCDLIADADVVVDCTDNFATRFMLNRVCYEKKVPLVSAAAIRFEGQMSVFDARQADSPCYQCLYHPDVNEELSCSEAGVISPLVGVMGSLQALEVIKLIAGIGRSLVGRLILFDAKSHQWRELSLPKDTACSVCS